MDPVMQMTLTYFAVTFLILLGQATRSWSKDRNDHSLMEYVWCRLKWWLLGVTAIGIIFVIGNNLPEIQMMLGAEAQKNMPPIVFMALAAISMVSMAILASCIPVCALAALADLDP